MKQWLAAVAMAANQLVNAIAGGNPDMTISARVAYARERGGSVAAKACDVLDWLDPRDGDSPKGDHCTIAIANHELRSKP